ncbi:hypothetical protein TNCV_2347771 [Trichonephila clavipes]|nr:hypothetical protein TNCV_2347771 [Trichonephila clavipes]
MDDQYIVLRVKRTRYQTASAIAQQLCVATGRQVSWFNVTRPFTKDAYLPIVLNTTSLREIPISCTVWSVLRNTKTGHLINGVVSSLRMGVVSVPQAIVNASLFGEVRTRFHPNNITERTATLVLKLSSGEVLC